MTDERELAYLKEYLDVLRQRVAEYPYDIESLECILFYTKRCIVLERLVAEAWLDKANLSTP